MKVVRLIVLGLFVLGITILPAFAGDAKNGKKLFNDSKFAGATANKSCSSCHPDGKGIEGAGAKQKFTVMGKDAASLEDVVNMCIEMAMKGKPILKDSVEMQDVVAYIKSLGTAKK
ncbi:cytochrome c family protein [Candidatus Magnetobacterium bavaricum]|uniref:Cytochrome c family protein n=1 Tax=Candidatus Magnetobacterium bavaricum TaxID=29290 RepID=A0A0F3GY16_9BACT|nr:cytochrome c family protein [Candidatus Magnetobacterium bavaricum]